MKPFIIRYLQILALAGMGVALMLVAGLLTGEKPAHALPEYAARTGEACATCHVNPGGGGPRTLRGLLWAAQGRPDQVPVLSNMMVAPGVSDGLELYDIACAGCHGLQGEGLFGAELVGSGLTDRKIRSTILRGRERSGMPAFEGQFTDPQLETLVQFVAGIASGEIPPPSQKYPLPAESFACAQNPAVEKCGGN
jgi:mono/diheme cytochrome c family protein